MTSGIDKIMENHLKVVEEAFVKKGSLKYNSYVVSNLRGGVGKSSLAFNLAYEISRANSLLIADLCPQGNLTDMLLKDISAPSVTIFKALQPKLLGPAFGEELEDFSYRVSEFCSYFKGGARCYFIAGDPEMFAFPSQLYQQLQLGYSRSGSQEVVRRLLHSLKMILDKEAIDKACNKILLDSSPFYAGGTHLAWCTAEALIIPVRVDEHSIESLELTLNMLTSPTGDFVNWNERAGGLPTPRIAAIVMTMVGAKSQLRATPDRASRMYIERALSIAEKYHDLFDFDDPSDAFVITDDFVSSGRISGAKSIPISELRVGSFHSVEGKRLQVNTSATRYKRELKYLASIL